MHSDMLDSEMFDRSAQKAGTLDQPDLPPLEEDAAPLSELYRLQHGVVAHLQADVSRAKAGQSLSDEATLPAMLQNGFTDAEIEEVSPTMPL